MQTGCQGSPYASILEEHIWHFLLAWQSKNKTVGCVQAQGLGHRSASTMPPPPPRPAPHMQAKGRGQNHDALTSSSDSDVDIDIDDVSPSQDSATAAWIERQRRCPEPFLTAPELLLAKTGRLHAHHCALSAPLGSVSDGQALLPTPAQALAIRHALGAQSSALAGSPAMLMPFPLSGPTRHAAAQHRLPKPTCSPASIGADLTPGLKSSRSGHKPPLYPAKRGLGEDTEARQQQLEPKQQAEVCVSISGQQAVQPNFFLCNMLAWLLNSSDSHLRHVQRTVVQVVCPSLFVLCTADCGCLACQQM